MKGYEMNQAYHKHCWF